MAGNIWVGVNVVSSIRALVIYLKMHLNHCTYATNLSKMYHNLHGTSVLGRPLTACRFSPFVPPRKPPTKMNGAGIHGAALTGYDVDTIGRFSSQITHQWVAMGGLNHGSLSIVGFLFYKLR